MDLMRILTDQASQKRKLSSKQIFAIFQALTVNKDMAELLESKGVDFQTLESLCDFASVEAERRELDSGRTRKARSEEQRAVSSLLELLQNGINSLDHEFGDGRNAPKFVRHDGETYSIAAAGRTFELKCRVRA